MIMLRSVMKQILKQQLFPLCRAFITLNNILSMLIIHKYKLLDVILMLVSPQLYHTNGKNGNTAANDIATRMRRRWVFESFVSEW